MDDAKKILDEAEREGLQMSQGLLKLMLKMWEGARADIQAATAAAKRLKVVSILSAVLAVLCLCVCVYGGTVIHKQGGDIAALQGEVQALHKILEEGVVIEETSTTTEETTTTVEQDTGEGNGNNVFQAGENSSYTQNGGGE